jgi:hypothetical protein
VSRRNVKRSAFNTVTLTNPELAGALLQHSGLDGERGPEGRHGLLTIL